MYTLYGRGKYYTIDERGRFFVGEYPKGYFSENWTIKSIVPRWNGRPASNWESLKKLLDNGEVVQGYLYDIDHGTTRFWGGCYQGKVPKVVLRKT